jgi:hypothetical protein
MKRPEVKIAFAAFELVEGLHVTIGRRYDASDHDIFEMTDYIENILKPQLPFIIHFGNYCHMGENNTIPAYRVYFEDPFNLIKDFYLRFYKEADGKALYPRPKFHVTVDTPEKRRTIESLMRGDTTFHCQYLSLKSRVEADVDDKGWKCQTCGNFNPLQQKECLSRGCDQWRPVGASVVPWLNNIAVEMKPGDWMCCGYVNFGSRPNCAKCGTAKVNPAQNNNIAPMVDDVYALPPSAPPVAEIAVQAEPPKPSAVRESYYIPGCRDRDWMCVRCNFRLFGSKSRCKCGTKRPG